ncbi:ATP-dependent endonuclease [Burkholderia sp. L27(2015)]|uniref:ATP-dependent nuclease n=1 Tax=Burkholderia sp. L27(2015) TaxID=1641858 RepID=UPI00131B7247|nr:AAA family ATPase [Burkholderia sp. L27(2015)]
MYVYRLEEFESNDGTKVNLGDLTVIIGPNNAGKSRALKDLSEITTTPSYGLNAKVIKNATTSVPTDLNAAFEAYAALRGTDSAAGISVNSLNPSLQGTASMNWGGPPKVVLESWRQGIAQRDKATIAQVIGSRLTTHLLTENRLHLLVTGPNVSNDNPATLLQQLYLKGTQKELELRQIVKATFGVELALDFTLPTELCLRVKDTLGPIPPDPRDAHSVLKELEKLDNQGDGLRSFVGIVAALLVMDRPVCLIDEPEAFLHPPQAHALGRLIASRSGPSKQLVIATHSADVLRGVLSVKNDISVVRIDRIGDANAFRQLAPSRLSEITKDPLLASHRVIDGLFSSAAIVVEADSDARFYETIFSKIHPNADIHFVSADNKQTVPRIASLYRDLGVRTAGIVDIDVLNNADEFSKQIGALNIDEAQTAQLTQAQSTLAKSVTGKTVNERADALLKAIEAAASDLARVSTNGDDSATDKALKRVDGTIRKAIDDGKPWADAKARGVEAFNDDGKAAFETIFEICANAGLFINRYGELESMLSDVGLEYTSDKRNWIQSAIPLATNLSYPSEKRAFSFMKIVDRHLFPVNKTQ